MRNDVTTLELKPAGGVVKLGSTVQLNLFALNKHGRSELVPGNMATWSSTDNQLAEVNHQGRITPRRAGTVTIVASYAALQATAVFTLTD